MRTNERVTALVTFAALATIPTLQAQEIPVVTLDEAIELAVRVSPTIITARGDLDVAEASRREYIGDWLPSISTSSSFSTSSSSRFNEATQTTISAASTSYSAGLSASYTLFDGFRRNATGRSTGANIESAEATLVNQRFQVVLDTKQAFFQAVAAEELVRVAETQIQRAENQLRISKESLAAGAAIRSDTLRSFVELGNARLQLLNARTARATATANLARLIGYDAGEVRVDPEGTLGDLAEIDTTMIREEVLSTSPTIQQVDAAARAADAQVRVSRGQYWPTVSASYSQNWAGSQISSLNNTWNARLSLSWPLFNGFAREAGIARSVATQDAAHARVDDTRRQVSAQLTQQFAALESARVRHQIAIASNAAAQEDLRVQQERYRLGVSTIVDVLASQVNLDQSEVDMVQSRLDFFLAKAEIEALIGRVI